MELRRVTDEFSVSPQIIPGDVEELEAIAAAAEEAGYDIAPVRSAVDQLASRGGG